MAESKDGNTSFFRKVVRFVANPATDWADASTRQDDSHELEKSELKAMVERKRRNDFVRKREFDTLRKLRRDGLSPEQLAALGGSSRVDDSESARQADTVLGARAGDGGVKAKIDEIEQQMAGEQGGRDAAALRRTPVRRQATPTTRPVQHPSDFYSASTEPAAFNSSLTAGAGGPGVTTDVGAPVTPLPALRDLDFTPMSTSGVVSGGLSLQSPALGGHDARHKPTHPMSPAATSAPGPVSEQPDQGFPPSSRFAVEVNEVVHDPELDEAVIAFANADFAQAEHALAVLVKPQAPRHKHAETWHVLMDLYRATGQQSKFESMAFEYANLFGRSSPQWYSLPKRVADAVGDARPDTRGIKGDVGWVSPALLDADAVARLRAATLQLPLPWVLDWTALTHVEAQAATQLGQLFRQWAPQAIDMRWLAGERLMAALQEAAPTGVRDADPAFWMARLEALRLANRPDQFDECAIDYCVTFEVSPPSWEPARCAVRASSGNQTTTVPPMSTVSDGASSFLESGLHDDVNHGAQVTTVELSGQLTGDIGSTLNQVDKRLGMAMLVQVSCAKLIRVDFIAAGDLLNWVLSKQNEGRRITFTDAHRLVALFFGAMGINEHARVQVPRD